MLRILALAPLLALKAPAADASVVRLEGQGIRLEFDEALRSRVVATWGGVEVVAGPFSASEALDTEAGEVAEYRLEAQDEQPVSDAIGSGRRHRLTGRAGDLGRTVEITFYDDFPGLAVVQAVYTNHGRGEIRVRGWTNGRYSVAASARAGKSPPSGPTRAARTRSVPTGSCRSEVGFAQDNYQGMNASDYGGGTPVVDVWRRGLGLAVGHVEPSPRLVSLPVARPDARPPRRSRSASRRTAPSGRARASRRCAPSWRCTRATTSGPSRRTADSWAARASAHPWRPRAAFEPIWCAWGYGRTFTTDQVLASLPVVEEARLRLGDPRRRLAGGGRRLDAGPREVPAGRRRHEGVRGRRPRGGLQGPALVGSARGRSRKLGGAGAPRPAPPQHGRVAPEDHVVGLPLPVSGLGARPRRRRGPSSARRSASGASTA